MIINPNTADLSNRFAIDKTKFFISLTIVFVLGISLGILLMAVLGKNSQILKVEETRPIITPPPPDEPTFCTTDAKICPDGTGVGRVPPNCEFAPCPSSKNN
ncbi:MAG: hypothetical protein U0525_02330 [Patescibacteria group bacterium]